jgi:uncharacterized protein
MNTIKSNANVTDSTDLETTYRQARDVYNQITDYGNSTRFKPELIPPNIECLNELDQQLQPFYKLIYQLRDLFIIFQKLADLHFSKAYFPLAIMYLGVQGITSNRKKSDFYFTQFFIWCFEHREILPVEILTELGYMYLNAKGVEQNYVEAVTCYRKAAEQDDQQAVFWYQKAADQGFRLAQSRLGHEYKEGRVLEQSDALSFFWHHKAADQGNEWSQYNLGDMYRDGRGVEQDDGKAAFWYHKAAGQAHEGAQYKLANMYKEGRGVEQDDLLAKYWLSKVSDDFFEAE